MTADEFLAELRAVEALPPVVYVNCTLRRQLKKRHYEELQQMNVEIGDLCCPGEGR